MSKSYNYQPAGTVTVTTTGNIAQLDPQGNSVVLMNNATLATIQGIKQGYPGQKVTVISIGAGEVDLAHQNSSASANDRLINYVTSGITPLAAGAGKADYQYDDVTGRWRLVNHNQGTPISVPYNSGDFTASAGTWTVSSGNVGTFQFLIRQNQILIDLFISNTSVSATPQHLDTKIPNGYVIVRSKRQIGAMIDNGTGTTGFLQVSLSGTVVGAFRDVTAANWAISASLTYVLASIEFGIN